VLKEIKIESTLSPELNSKAAHIREVLIMIMGNINNIIHLFTLIDPKKSKTYSNAGTKRKLKTGLGVIRQLYINSYEYP
jgi:hypothetical protein